MYCIETKNLSHSFSPNATVLNNINLKVPHGSLYGFLGPNGAGKTTTLRLLLGLLKKQQGEIFITGKNLQQNRIKILKEVGSMIESPSLYGHLTANENLRLLQKIYGCPQSRINEVLTITGILNTGQKKVNQFSLGMKQRLAIAVALLNNPSLLILDEPTNGLDPYGILEIRALLKKLNEEHAVTIVVSSHLLTEIEKLVTHVGIINKGAMLFQDTLKALTEMQLTSAKTTLKCNAPEKALEIIQLFNHSSTVLNDRIILPALSPLSIAQLNKHLVQKNIEVYEISTLENDLETIFMELINKN